MRKAFRAEKASSISLLSSCVHIFSPGTVNLSCCCTPSHVFYMLCRLLLGLLCWKMGFESCSVLLQIWFRESGPNYLLIVSCFRPFLFQSQQL